MEKGLDEPMSTTYLSYHLMQGGRDSTLAVRLEEGASLPVSVLLKHFHVAAQEWRDGHSAAVLRSSVGRTCAPGAHRVSFSDYFYADDEFNPARFRRHLSFVAEIGRIPHFIPRPGAPVEGDDLWGRVEEREELIHCLQNDSCHLRAPRRYGKTSLLRSAQSQLAVAGAPVLFVDLSGSESVAHFLAILAEAAMEHESLGTVLAGAVPGFRGWPAPGADADVRSSSRKQLLRDAERDPRSFAISLLTNLAAHHALVLLDEFSLFLRIAIKNDGSRLRVILELLKEHRYASPPLHVALAGSAGLSAYLNFHGMQSLLGDLIPVDLKPLERGQASVLAEELFYGSGFKPSSDAAHAVLDEIGIPVPYFVHVLCDAAREQAGTATVVTADVVRTAYRDRILGALGNYVFKVYRLDQQSYPEALARPAGRILRALAEKPNGVAESKLRKLFREAGRTEDEFDSLMACLSEDYDVEKRSTSWRMRSKVLRDRWLLFGASDR